MLLLLLALVAGGLVLVASTKLFVDGAALIAGELRVSSVLVGAVILGCGTGLPELALAFHRDHDNPLRHILGLTGGGPNLALVGVLVVLVVVLTVPTLFPHSMPRHSPLILATTIAFAALLRGSLDIVEGGAMLTGFGVGIALVLRGDRGEDFDPFAPIIEDDYDYHGGFIEGPVMTPVQVATTRCLVGLVGTAIGAQLFAFSLQDLMKRLGAGETLYGLVFVASASVLPHVVVALQALSHHHKGLAVGNLIGSNLFQSLVIGGLVAVIRPYEPGGSFSFSAAGIIAATAALTWMLLHTSEELSRRQGLVLLGAYVTLVSLAVP